MLNKGTPNYKAYLEAGLRQSSREATGGGQQQDHQHNIRSQQQDLREATLALMEGSADPSQWPDFSPEASACSFAYFPSKDDFTVEDDFADSHEEDSSLSGEESQHTLIDEGEMNSTKAKNEEEATGTGELLQIGTMVVGAVSFLLLFFIGNAGRGGGDGGGKGNENGDKSSTARGGERARGGRYHDRRCCDRGRYHRHSWGNSWLIQDW